MARNSPSSIHRQLWLTALVLLSSSACRSDVDHIAALRARITSPSVEVRRAAIAEMQQMGALSDENVALLENALRDKDPAVRHAAAQALVFQTVARPELAERLVNWASATSDPQCRELFEQAAVGKIPAAPAE